jgi:hypothetical protein
MFELTGQARAVTATSVVPPRTPAFPGPAGRAAAAGGPLGHAHLAPAPTGPREGAP